MAVQRLRSLFFLFLLAHPDNSFFLIQKIKPFYPVKNLTLSPERIFNALLDNIGLNVDFDQEMTRKLTEAVTDGSCFEQTEMEARLVSALIGFLAAKRNKPKT